MAPGWGGAGSEEVGSATAWIGGLEGAVAVAVVVAGADGGCEGALASDSIAVAGLGCEVVACVPSSSLLEFTGAEL